MRYALCLLTSPGREACLERTLASFERYVKPRPVEQLVYCDGGDSVPRPLYDSRVPWNVSGARWQGGFCRATRNLWNHAATASSDWVFWLEDDFEFTRPVFLPDLAVTLDEEPQLAQMVLYRQAVNSDEVAAGGYMEQHPEEYTRKGGGTSVWFEHRNHWTTNPSLFRTSICRDYPWPDGPFCEGKFGFRIRELRPNTTFGIWGSGDVWVNHIGERIGTGY